MTDNNLLKPDYLFEVSWEVCNKVGGIYTVVSTKALTLENEFNGNYFLIGPEVWKETQDNTEFIEDKLMFKALREKAEADGLFFRVGRWNIQGSPLAILVDFTTFFGTKDKIFADFWVKYQLDSISGQWDYIEPAMFGYAAAKVIEHFYLFNLNAQDRIAVHFHEWMTGTGLLYLKDKVPQAATVFTTHATILGRSIAGNSMPLYRDLQKYDGELMSYNLGIRAKFSLEKTSAHEADCFTTVSQITVDECRQFLKKEVDVVTPNGFENSFVPSDDHFNKARSVAREKLFSVAEAVTGTSLNRDSLLIINSGRYEFRNKGIDLFIDTLWKLNNDPGLEKDVVAFITIPAHQTGPRHELIERMGRKKKLVPDSGSFVTHDLFDIESDPIIQRIRRTGLTNDPANRVKIIFVPAYLNGSDGIFDMDYYQLLIGFDLSVFPSYYEPWGYTPLESLAFRIPTITTSLTGFGLWMQKKNLDLKDALYVVERSEDNTVVVVDNMASIICDYSVKSEEEVAISRSKAGKLAKEALWEKLILHYQIAFSQALEKAAERIDLYRDKQIVQYIPAHELSKSQRPVWRKIMVEPSLPKQLAGLQKLAWNLWWNWNTEATEIFASIDPDLWTKSGYNPIALIELLTFDQIRGLAADNHFIARLERVMKEFNEYMAKSIDKPREKVAYFSMEFGLDDSIKLFSGGLGMLAGDYLKEASDSNANIIGIGLLYRYGYFNQSISLSGDQVADYVPQRFTHLPMKPVRKPNGEWLVVSIALPGRNLYAKAWKLDVGRIPLYLLDTDIEENNESDRSVTHQLYGGDWENRFKQELLLGVGGIRMLQALEETPTVFHCNEGHAACIGLERLRILIQDEKLNFQQAMEVVKASSLFTTHTPVPAGHDSFSEDILRTYIPHYADRLGISWDTFMDLGRFNPGKSDEKFSMSVLAAKLSQETNGVSRIHGRVSRQMFKDLYPGYFPEEIHIGYVTNGVHMPTWVAKSWKELYIEAFGKEFLSDQANPDHWEKIQQIDNQRIWDTRSYLRKSLIDYIRQRMNDAIARRNENPHFILEALDRIDENTLTIGFARRFATYKRAHLLFTDPERLSKILNNPQRPVQLIYAGKAHPYDKAGQDLIKKVVEISRKPEFVGKIMFLENYDISLAKKLIQGVDIWLNTPTRPLEASGTSGEKAVMNGVINLSVLDGWWAEGYRPGAGWALKETRTFTHQPFQDELDADTIYTLLEDEIAPMFYQRDENGIPNAWVSFVKNTIAQVAPHFTMKRMLDDYYKKYYNKLFERSASIGKDGYKVAREIAAWKRKMLNAFDSIQVLSVKIPDSNLRPLHLGEGFLAEIEIDLAELSAEDISVEVVFGKKENDEVKSITTRNEMSLARVAGGVATFSCEIPSTKSGVFDYAFRIFPKNELLPHRQDLSLLRWI